MSFDASQYMRYAIDFTLAQTSILGVSPYSVYIVQITNDQVDILDTDVNRTITSTRVLIADGYRSYSSEDGYLNPILKEEFSQTLVISSGQLVAEKMILGPLVFPYTANGFSGGIDVNLFQPAIGSNNNIQVYVQIRGVGLSPQGNFFDIEAIHTSDMSGLSYIVELKSNNMVVI